MSELHILYVGLTTKHGAKLTDEQFTKALERGADECRIAGYTVYPTQGRYNGVREESRAVYLYDIAPGQVVALATSLRLDLEQEAIGCEYRGTQFTLLTEK